MPQKEENKPEKSVQTSKIMTKPLPQILDEIEESILKADEAAKNARDAAEEARRAGEKAASEASKVAAQAIARVEEVAGEALKLAESIRETLLKVSAEVGSSLGGKEK